MKNENGPRPRKTADDSVPLWVAILPKTIQSRLRGRNLLVTLIGNVGWHTTDKAIRTGLGLITTVVIARYFGPKGFGELNYGIAFVALFAPLGAMGVQAIVGRELVRRPQERERILAGALQIRFGGTAIAIAASISCIWLISSGETETRSIVIAQALALLPLAWEVVDYDFYAAMRPGPVVIARATACLLFSGIRWGMVIGKFPLVAFAWTTFGEYVLGGALLIAMARREGRGFRITQSNRKELSLLLRQSLPLLLSGLSIMLYMRIDQVMLGQWSTKAEAGLFSAAVRISEAWYFLPMVVVTAAAPALTAAHQIDTEAHRRLMQKLMKALVWASASISIVTAIAAGPLVRLLYGEAYSPAAYILAIHVWAGVFVALGVGAGPWFVNEGLQRIQVTQTIVGAVTNISLNALVIPKYGAIGASIVTVLSYFVSAVLVNAFLRETRPIFLIQLRAMAPRWNT